MYLWASEARLYGFDFRLVHILVVSTWTNYLFSRGFICGNSLQSPVLSMGTIASQTQGKERSTTYQAMAWVPHLYWAHCHPPPPERWPWPHYGTCYIGNHVCEGQLRDVLTLTQSSRTLESGKHECHVGVMFRRTMPAWKEPLALVRFPWAGGCRGCWKPGRSYPPGSSGQWGNGRFTKEEPAWLPKNLWRVWGRAGSAQGLGAGAERVVEEEVCWAIKAGCSWQGAGEHCLVRSERELQARWAARSLGPQQLWYRESLPGLWANDSPTQPLEPEGHLSGHTAESQLVGGGGLVAKSCLTLVTPWTVACQTPLSMGFSRQEYWSRLPFPSSEDLPDPGIESPTLQADSLPTELWRKPGSQLSGEKCWDALCWQSCWASRHLTRLAVLWTLFPTAKCAVEGYIMEASCHLEAKSLWIWTEVSPQHIKQSDFVSIPPLVNICWLLALGRDQC